MSPLEQNVIRFVSVKSFFWRASHSFRYSVASARMTLQR